jgi:hypothetical protein
MAIAGVFASVTIGAIVDRPASGERSVVIHVVDPDLDVGLDDVTYPVATVYDPIECQLPVGVHRLVMRRGDDILLDEPFEVEPGRDVVLTAWRRPRAGASR